MKLPPVRNETAALLPPNLNRAMAVERTRDLRRRSGDRPERSDFDVANRADRWVACVAVILLVLGLLSFVEGLTVVAHATSGPASTTSPVASAPGRGWRSASALSGDLSASARGPGIDGGAGRR